MHRVELLEQAKAVAERLGYRIRQEWLGGSRGGSCEISGQKWLFIDLTLSVSDQLDQTVEALREDGGIHRLTLPSALSDRLGIRKSA